MKTPKGCKKYEILLEVLKTDYDKVWIALIATSGGVGGFLIKGVINWLTFLTAFLIVLEVAGLLFIRFKLLKTAEKLENCKED